MFKDARCNLRGPNSVYCTKWCLLKKCQSIKVNKNNVLTKNASNQSAKMRFSKNVQNNFKKSKAYKS